MVGEYSVVFLFGGVLYGLAEVAYMGKTHPAMLLAGGLCFLVFYITEKSRFIGSLFLKWVFGGAVVTAVELFFGIVFNLILKMEIWDYSFRMINLLGQISLVNSLGWFALAVPAFALCRLLLNNFGGKHS